MPLQIRGVEDADDEVRERVIFICPEEDAARNLLVRSATREGIAARQIDEFEFATVGGVKFPALDADGDAGVVSDFLRRAAESVEQGRLSRVRISGQGDRFKNFLHALGGLSESSDGRHHDLLGEIAAHGETSAADRANEISSTRKLADLERLTKPEIPQLLATGTLKVANLEVTTDLRLGEALEAVDFEILDCHDGHLQ